MFDHVINLGSRGKLKDYISAFTRFMATNFWQGTDHREEVENVEMKKMPKLTPTYFHVAFKYVISYFY